MNESEKRGRGFWYFQRLKPGEFVRVPATRFNAFFDGKKPLGQAGGQPGYVYLVDIVMTLLNRKPVGVERAFFHRLPVNERGLYDEDLRLTHMRASMDAVSFRFARDLPFPGMPPPPPPNVVPAESRFGLQTYRWKPTKEDWDSLRDTLQAIANKRLSDG